MLPSGPRRALAFAATCLASLTTGCAFLGTTVVDHDIDITAHRAGPSGTWLPHPTRRVPVSPARRASFADTEFRTPDIAITFGKGMPVFGGEAITAGDRKVCLHLRVATVASNFAPAAQPLRIIGATQGLDPLRGIQFRNRPGERREFDLERMCFGEGRFGLFSVWPDRTGLFPNGTLFNVQVDATTHAVIATGAGNWIEVTVPIEAEGAVEVYRFRMTLKETRARKNYH